MSAACDIERVRRDFDDIAQLPPQRWGHNSHYHRFLLRQLPAVCGDVIDVGCGTGDFARLLAPRSRSVVGIDLSPEMIRVAQRQSVGVNNLQFVVADFMNHSIAEGSIDVVASIAALHHVAFEPALRVLKGWLKPRGRLIILDMFASGYGRDLAWKLPAKALSAALSLVHNRRLRFSREARLAWKRHAKTDSSILPLDKIRQIASQIFPGASVKQHLLWRYSLVWTKPSEEQ